MLTIISISIVVQNIETIFFLNANRFIKRWHIIKHLQNTIARRNIAWKKNKTTKSLYIEVLWCTICPFLHIFYSIFVLLNLQDTERWVGKVTFSWYLNIYNIYIRRYVSECVVRQVSFHNKLCVPTISVPRRYLR